MWKLILLTLILQLPAYGETVTVVFPPDVETNHVINVPANQAIRMHYVVPQYGCYLTKDSVTLQLTTDVQPATQVVTVQGPAVFEFKGTNSPGSGAVFYQTFPANGLITKTYDITEGLSISVPAGKTLRIVDIFRTSQRPSINATVTSSGGIISPQINLTASHEAHLNFFIAGPVTLNIQPYTVEGTPPIQYITYYFAEDAVQIPEGALQVSSQNSVTIEKSTDLSNWTAITILEPPKEPKAFYRLKAAQ